MPIPFLKRTEPEAAAAPRPPGAEVLREGVLLAHWYILYRLDEEMERARRYQRPLSIMIARPKLLPGEQSTALALEVGAAAAQAAARSTDLLGWLGSDSILMVMPETRQANANAAASRWRDDMWLRGQHVGGHQWQVVAMENVGNFETAEQLIQAATGELAGLAGREAA
jgi:hypothetical protein